MKTKTNFIIIFILFLLTIFLSSEQTFTQILSTDIVIIELNLEREYVLIENQGYDTINMENYVLEDDNEHKEKVFQFIFPVLELKHGEVLQVLSGKDPNKYVLEYVDHWITAWDRYVWNNDEDCAYLYNENRELISKLCENKD